MWVAAGRVIGVRCDGGKCGFAFPPPPKRESAKPCLPSVRLTSSTPSFASSHLHLHLTRLLRQPSALSFVDRPFSHCSYHLPSLIHSLLQQHRTSSVAHHHSGKPTFKNTTLFSRLCLGSKWSFDIVACDLQDNHPHLITSPRNSLLARRLPIINTLLHSSLSPPAAAIVFLHFLVRHIPAQPLPQLSY